MATCLDNLIGIDSSCEEAPLSGLFLMDAPEISTKNLANIANEDYISGKELARKKIDLAVKLFQNDLMSVLAQSGFLPDISTKTYSSGDFVTTKTFPAEAKERGVVLYRNRRHTGNLRKTVIHKVFVYPLNSATDVSLKVYEDYTGGIVSTYTVDLIGNEVNTFGIDHKLKGTYAKVVLDGTNVSVASSYLTCMTGCHGTMPNECGYTKGFYNGKEVQGKEGFGINIEFSCVCDYDEFLCDLSKRYIGEMLWLKARVLVMEEHLRSNRLNNWVIYKGDELKSYMIDVENQYITKWNSFIAGLPNLIKHYKDDCLDCKRFRWVVNI